eukprot:12630471-Alexandrium_andersonii.AAC.1
MPVIAQYPHIHCSGAPGIMHSIMRAQQLVRSIFLKPVHMDGIDGGPGIGSQEADSHMPCVYFIPNSGDTGPSGNSRGIPGMPAHW